MNLIKEKMTAVCIHLLISAILAAIILAILFFYWFPQPLMGLGAVQGVTLILIVDLVIGPLCTLLIYKKGKPGMTMDLVVIGLVQITAICYGLWAVSTQKPAFMVLTHTGLEVVSVYDRKKFIEDFGGSVSEQTLSETLSYSDRVPVVAFEEAEDAYARGGKRFEFEFNNGRPYYFDYSKYSALKNFEAFSPVASGLFEKGENCYWLAFSSPHGSAKACLKQHKGKLEKI